MRCSKCHAPMVDPDDGMHRYSDRPYSGRLCLDCRAAIPRTPVDEMDCWEYMNRRGLQFRLRDAARMGKESNT